MTLHKPTIVIFDMDGTTVRHINPWVLNVLERLDDFAHKFSKIFSWLFHKGARGPIDLSEPNPRRGKKRPRLLVHRAIHKVRRKSVEQIVEPCPGIYELLDLLRRHDIPVALVSNGLGKGYGHDILRQFDLEHYYKAIVFRENISFSKPHPEPLLEAVKLMGLSPTAQDVLWYIGDRHKDVLAALAAARILPCRIEPIACGVNAAVAIIEKNIGQDHIFMSFFDLRNRTEALLSEKHADKTADHNGSHASL